MNSYERIKKFIPVFYYGVREMDAIYRVDGEMLDELLKNIDYVALNRFILTAYEKTVERMERFLKIKVYPHKDLDERRRLIVAHYIGFGKINKTKIKEMMASFTGEESEVALKVFNSQGDEAIYIVLKRGENESINAADVKEILLSRIPGHLMIVCTVQYTNRQLRRFTHAELKKFTHYQMKYGIPIEGVK